MTPAGAVPRYVLVSPYPSARRNGVTTYIEHVSAFLVEHGLEPVCIYNDDSLRRADYQAFVRDTVTARFRPEEVLVEAPEVGCPTLLLPPAYRVHVRLHCPGAFVRWHNQKPLDFQQFWNEIRVARAAHVISSPSYALLRQLAPYVAGDSVHVYKNPPPGTANALVPPAERCYDVVFMGNFTRLKGVDLLNPVLTRLPPHYAVVLVGRESERFQVANTVRCRVTVGPHLPGPERLRLLAETRVALSLSRFENCSMLVLEGLATGTVVAGWDVGGHAEIAGPRVLRLVPLGEVEELVSVVVAAIDGAYPDLEEFRSATNRVRDDFRRGWSHLWQVARYPSAGGVYRGLDCGGGHTCSATAQ